MPGKLIPTRHTRYRHKYRAGGLTPLSPDAKPEVWSLPPNLAHHTDSYQSLHPHLEARHIDGVAFALTGERLEESLAVSGGHTHNTPKTLLTWRQLAAWPLTSDFSDVPEAATVQSSDADDVLVFAGVDVPPACTHLVARAKVTAQTGGGEGTGFGVIVELFGDADTTLSSPVSALLWWGELLTVSYEEAWRETVPLDISGLSFVGDPFVLARWRFFFKGGTSRAAVHECQLGMWVP